MMEYLLGGLAQLMTFETLLFMNIGIMVGIVFGAIPGLNGNLAITVLLPFTFIMSPVNAMLMLTSIFFAANFGGSISSILINTPGTNAAAATLLDGYPLTKRGFPNKALNIALVASTVGGLISAFALLLFSPQIARVALKFGPAEYFAIALFGLSVIASVSGKNMTKGLVAGAIGMLVSMVGMDAVSGVPRFTFGNIQFYAGIKMLPALLGVFAITNIIGRIAERTSETKVAELGKASADDELSVKEIKGLMPTMFKSGVIGSIIGAIPGAGGGIASFIAYNEASRTATPDEHFGQGEPKGLAAPESANNGATSATLIPLLTLGIPGDVVAATLLGAFMMHGLIPGPGLFRDQGVIIYAILLGFVLANFFMYIQGKFLLKHLIKLARVPQELLTACLVVIVATGAFTFGNSLFDVKVLMVFGVIGYIMSKLEFPLVPIVLGLVLGPIAEMNLRKALVLSQGEFSIFVTQPISLAFLLLTFVFIVLIKRSQKAQQKQAEQYQLARQ